MTPEVLIASGWGVLTAIRSTDGSEVWQVHYGTDPGTDSVGAFIMGTAVYTQARTGASSNGGCETRRVQAKP